MKQAIPPVKRHIIICAPRKSCILKALRQLKGKTFRWAYLGEDVPQFITIERLIGGAGKRIEIGGKLQEIAGSLRQAYIDYIGKLSVANNSLLWWAGSLSEKNPWASKTFLYACYIKLCQAIVSSGGEENLVFIGENNTIRQAVLANTPGYEIQRIEAPVPDLFATLKNAARFVAVKAYFLAQTIYRLWLARRYRKIQVNELSRPEGVVLLYNWVDARSFDAQDQYHDSYFGGLAQYLRNKGKKVAIIPVMSLTVSYRQMLNKLTQKLESFLLPESFLTAGDVISVLFKTTFNAPASKIYPEFEGMDISKIIRSDISRDRAGTYLISGLLLYKAVKRWKTACIPIATFIFPYENQVWEKVCCLALRKFYPSASLIGYQHSTVPEMLLSYFFSRDELPILPFPDKVITNGKYTEKLFKTSGYDPTKVVRGGAIRFLTLVNREKPAPIRKDLISPTILVALSGDRNETIELVWKVSRAFQQMKEYKIILKFHPDRPYRFVAKESGTLPEHFIISEKPTSELLPDSNVLLYMDTATSIEALALGIPILHVKSDFTIDRDNLGDFSSDIRESVSTPDDIVKATEKALKMDEKELSRKRQVWTEAVAEMFGLVDESTFDLFL